MSEDNSFGGWVGTQTVKGLKAAFVNLVDRQAVKSRTARIANLISHGKLTVVVVGAGGVGKSTVSRVLTSEEPLLVEESYKPSASLETYSLKGKLPITFLVATGQDSRELLDLRKDASWEEIFEVFSKKRALGFRTNSRVLILNVVSYGFHSYEGRLEDTDVYDPNSSNEEMKEKWLTLSREIEIDRLKKLSEGLGKIKRPALMMTVVTKEDLWRKIPEVETHYSDSEGNYLKELRALAKKFEDSNQTFVHHFIKAPVKHQNLVIGDPRGRHLLFETAAGFGFSDFVVGLENFLAAFETAARSEFGSGS